MRLKKRWLLLIFALLLLVLIGPWPVHEDEFRNSDYAQTTFSRIENLTISQDSGSLSAGAASIDITPAPGIPLGGYSARSPKENQGAMAPVYAKAISIDNGFRQISFISAEILLPLPQLVEAVVTRTGLAREQLYFSSTHTHSGPGAYDDSFVAQFALGDFHPEYFRQLVEGLSQAIITSRNNMQPVNLRFQRLQLPTALAEGLIHNQLNHGPGGHTSIPVLQLFTPNRSRPLASLISFSGHPTFLGRVNKKISGDYPGLLQQQLEQNLGGIVMFSVGAVGGMLPKGLGQTPSSELQTELNQMQDMASRLSRFIETKLASGAPETYSVSIESGEAATIDALLVPVDLPSPSYRISENWRLSPWLINTFFHDRKTYVHVARIGPVFWLGYPADYSGELAMSLEAWGNERNRYPWVTSFNGDYIGYASPASRYDLNHYTVRDVNFYGRWAGDYLNEIGKRTIEQMAADH